METLLIVVGGILVFFFGTLALACFTAIKNEKNFNKFLEEVDKKNAQMRSALSDEEMYSFIGKIQNFSAITFVIGLLLLGLGIAFIVL